MVEWFERYLFIKNPYERLDPHQIEDRFLVWNRPDLDETVRPQLTRFAEDVLRGRRVGLLAFGQFGIGKTWLTRLLEKEIREKSSKIPFIYTKIPKMEPTFQVVYRIAIENFLQKTLDDLVSLYDQSSLDLTRIDTWRSLVNNEELASGLMKWKQERNLHAKRWLIGDKLSSAELDALGITSSLDSDFDRFEMLKTILRVLSGHFENVVLVIDELENASTRVASQLGDGLRDIIDEFSMKFALVCACTAQRLDMWYDFGYSEALLGRLNYTIELASLRPESIAQFLRIHHKAYRSPDTTIDEQLSPFTEESAKKTLTLMKPEDYCPRYYLANCEFLARTAAEREDEEIGSSLVDEMARRLPFRK